MKVQEEKGKNQKCFCNKLKTFEECTILAKYKEGEKKDLGSWLKETTRNYKPETRNQVFK